MRDCFLFNSEAALGNEFEEGPDAYIEFASWELSSGLTGKLSGEFAVCFVRWPIGYVALLAAIILNESHVSSRKNDAAGQGAHTTDLHLR